jgi:linoleoyl-CoA desaturase
MTQAPLELPTVRFGRDTTGFAKALRQRVDAHFKEKGIHKKADARMKTKAIILVGTYLGSLALIATGATGGGWMFWATEILMGLGLAGIGMAVMHDGNHGAYSENKIANRWVGGVLEMVGGNSEMWQIQHNVLHHTFTNIDGLDEDIDPGPVLRFSPLKPLKPWHRFQHYYAWFFYGLMTLIWVTFKDFVALSKYHKYGLLKRMGKSRNELMFRIILAKVLYYPIVVGLPLAFSGLGAGQVIAGWLLMHFVGGLTLGLVFQPAHVMEDHDYRPAEKGLVIEDDPMSHQLKTTCNFGTKSRLLNWYSGGLTHQIEHHLFPHICHVHYSDISPIVRKTAEEFGLPYRADTSFWGALKLHTAQLRQLGRA